MEAGTQLLQLEMGLGAHMAVPLLSRSKAEGGWMAGGSELPHWLL